MLHSNLDPTTLFLVSADRPGCGSSTLSESLGARLQADLGSPVGTYSVGNLLRKALGVTNETEMQGKLAGISDPHAFDSKVYGEEIPPSGIHVIDGKLATTAAPLFVAADRPLITIDLTAPTAFSAKRMLQRDGIPLSTVFGSGKGTTEHFVDYFEKAQRRAVHDQELRDQFKTTERADGLEPNIVGRFAINTSELYKEELVAHILGDTSYEHTAPSWEINGLTTTIKTLYALGLDFKHDMKPADTAHFAHQLESINYGVERLRTTTNSHGLEVIRGDLKKAIVDCWFGIMLKRIPRFFTEKDNPGAMALDTITHEWSPDFYKIAEGWPTLSAVLKDQVVLDPFAGSGTLLNLLVARGIPKSAIFADISYHGGQSVNGGEHSWYNPRLNQEVSQLLFDELPSWYKPSYERVAGHVTSDAISLPFANKSVDYIFSDPPYGKNFNHAGIGTLFGSIAELNRVARKGSILMVPVTWLNELRAGGVNFVELTKDVSNGTSGLPVCYIHMTALPASKTS